MSSRPLPVLLTTLLPKRQSRPATDLFALWRSRRALARLDAAGRADVGLTLGECVREAGRPIWDVPHHWVD